MARDNFIPRIFAKRFVNDMVVCDKAELFYLRTVRVSVGDYIEVFVKSNEIYHGEITEFNFGGLFIKNIEQVDNPEEEQPSIHLAFSLSSKEATRDALDFAVQGNVASISPFTSQLSDNKSSFFLEKKGFKIVLESVRQSRRHTFAKFKETKDITGVADYFRKKGVKKVIIADVNSQNPDKSFFNTDTYGLVIGPESGFTQEDIESIKDAMAEFEIDVFSFSNSTMRVQIACAAIPNYIRGMHRVING